MLKCVIRDCPTPASRGNYCADCWDRHFAAPPRRPWPRTQDARFVLAVLVGCGLVGLVLAVGSGQPGRVVVVMSSAAAVALGLGLLCWMLDRVFDWILRGDVR
jgi:hypothetical protein